ncbi:MAG TPA: succinylglutamate desuccinylase/aspartoacylase family protein [Desulfuromonadales bacterium]|nr:succinylglutamate desuccinylase/aspartoacylase family protein [Desulfuromonadales bacterium]
MAEAIRIGEVTIQPGERLTVDLPTAHLYTHTEMTMPVHVIHGKKPGPRLFVCAALHGDEINGVEIIRRLLQLKLLAHLHGTLLAIPIVNVFGFVSRTRYLPDRRDLNRAFPGSVKGSLTARLARLFMDEIVDKCTHGIDLHSGANHRINLPQIRAGLDEPETERLARAFGAPVIIDARLRDGSLRMAGAEKGIPTLVYEGGEALRFREGAITAGLRGIVNVMREIGMLSRRTRTKEKTTEPLVARSTVWVRAPKSGILVSGVVLGARVKKGEVLATVADPFGEQEVKVRAPLPGIVIGRLNLPLVHSGDALFHLAVVDRSAGIDAILEALESGLDLEELGEDRII